jgi:hypothetical protein
MAKKKAKKSAAKKRPAAAAKRAPARAAVKPRKKAAATSKPRKAAPPKRAVDRVRADLDLVFRELKEMLTEYGGALRVQADKAGTYYLNTLRKDASGQPQFFGGARKGKNYVSLYLMPVYEFADLLSAVPADLQKRMQGKSCFNFRTLSEIPREEVKRLIDAAVTRVKAATPANG